MPIDPQVREILDQLQDSLGGLSTPNLNEDTDSWDIYEVYAFSIVLEAARIEGATVHYENVYGEDTSEFIFRTSPGVIYSTAHPYTHAVIEFENKPVLETHLGVKASGKSGILHEHDVSVIWQEEADSCRVGGVSPRAAKILLAIECKFYGSDLPLHLGRSFLGLVQEFSQNTSCFLVSNVQIEEKNISRLLTKHKRKWQGRVVPDSENDIKSLRHLCQEVFKNFKAAN